MPREFQEKCFTYQGNKSHLKTIRSLILQYRFVAGLIVDACDSIWRVELDKSFEHSMSGVGRLHGLTWSNDSRKKSGPDRLDVSFPTQSAKCSVICTPASLGWLPARTGHTPYSLACIIAPHAYSYPKTPSVVDKLRRMASHHKWFTRRREFASVFFIYMKDFLRAFNKFYYCGHEAHFYSSVLYADCKIRETE